MIKFKVLIHKKTGTIIEYDTWIKCVKNDNGINITHIDYAPKGNTEYSYKPRDMLFSNEFEIVYNPELTTKHLELICNCAGFAVIKKATTAILEKREKIKSKYGYEI